MKNFLEHRIAFFALLSASILVFLYALSPTNEGLEDPVHLGQKPNAIRYRDIKGPMGSTAVLYVDMTAGSKIRACTLGNEQIILSFDNGSLWFWVRHYDANQFYFCDIEDIDKAGLSPIFRPFFLKSSSGMYHIWNPHPEDGTIEVSDGEYLVSIEFKGGLPKKQSYVQDGKEIMTIHFVEFQEAAGFQVPKKLTVDFGKSDRFEIDMGPAEFNPKCPLKTEFPKGMKGIRLPLEIKSTLPLS